MKAVLDTNVIIAAFLSAAPESTGRRLLDHWSRGTFRFLYSRDTFLEYAEILLRKGVPADKIRAFLSELRLNGNAVEILFFHLPVYPGDADDVSFLLCALNGQADFLVSYDSDLLALSHAYELKITQPHAFLLCLL